MNTGIAEKDARELEDDFRMIEKDLNDAYLEIIPAQDFINGVCYVTISETMIQDKGSVKQVPFVVTSDKQKIRLCKEELFKRDLYTNRYGYPQQKWSKKGVEKFLSGEKCTVKIQEVYENIVNLFKHYIAFTDDEYYKLISCWIIGTYFHRLFVSYPYVILNANMECGKTKTLTLTSLLSFNGELTFNSTPAYIISVIHQNSATCCIDEAEKLKGSKDENMLTVIAMYNQGYKKGSFCGKMEQSKDNKWKLKQFEAYCPKMFANIRGAADTLMTRCIPITMIRTGNKLIQNSEITPSSPEFSKLRDDLYLVMMNYHSQIKKTYEGLQDSEILGREWELWKPILTIAKTIDSDLYLSLRGFGLTIMKNKKENLLSNMVTPQMLKLVKELILLKKYNDNYYSAKGIVDWLIIHDGDNFGWLETAKSPGRWLGDELRKAGLVKGQAVVKKCKDGSTIRSYYITVEMIDKQLQGYV